MGLLLAFGIYYRAPTPFCQYLSANSPTRVRSGRWESDGFSWTEQEKGNLWGMDGLF